MYSEEEYNINNATKQKKKFLNFKSGQKNKNL